MTDYSAWRDVMLALRQNVVNRFPGDKELLYNVRIVQDPVTGDALFIWQGVHWEHGGPTEKNFVEHLEDALGAMRSEDFLYIIMYPDGDIYVAGDFEDNNFHIKPKHCMHFIDPSKDVWESEYTKGYQAW